MSQPPLTRKTKNELLEEYNKLLERYEEMKMGARILGEPSSLALLEQIKDYTPEKLTQTISELKNTFNESLNQLAEKLATEAKKLTELQQALELSKKNLELHYHIQVAAETLERLVQDYKVKTVELEEELAKKKREAAWQEEEQNHTIIFRRKKEEEIYQLEQERKERELVEREAALKAQEMEIQKLRSQVEAMPKQLESALAAKEQEVTRRLQVKFEQEQTMASQEWEAKKSLLELTNKNLEQQIKRQDAEIAVLKQEVEQAGKKAQELAVKVIESSRSAGAMAEDTKT